MKRSFFLLIFLVGSLLCTAQAQTVVEKTATDTVTIENGDLAVDSLPTNVPLPLPRPVFSLAAPGFDGCSPWFRGTYGPSWYLHEGFNAQLGMSISAGLGKHAPSGVGFGQSAAFAYALPLNKRFSLAAGVYAQNMDWGAFHNTDVGFSAVLGYKVNDAISLYAYGTKSFKPKNDFRNVGYFPLYMDYVRDRIGAMAEFKIGENAAIQISVERSSSPAPRSGAPIRSDVFP